VLGPRTLGECPRDEGIADGIGAASLLQRAQRIERRSSARAD
jgi:hypothetical protein